MRTRIRGYDKPIDLLVKRSLDIVAFDADGFPYIETVSDTITIGNTMKMPNYEYIKDISPGWHNYNRVLHLKSKFSGSSAPPMLTSSMEQMVNDPDGSNLRYVTLNRKVEWSHYDAAALPSLPGPSFASGAKFTNDTIQKATEQFGEEISIANFLYELREAADLFVRDWALKLLLGKIGESYLSWQFGWKPLLADVKKLASIATKVKKRLLHLKKTNEKYVTEQFRMTVNEENVDQIPESLNDLVLDYAPDSVQLREAVQTEYRLKSLKHIFVATVVINRHLEGLDDSLALAKGLENALGLNNLPKVLWNATPFSWMVEWFINLARPLAKFDVEPFKGRVVIISCNYSVKTVGEYAAYGGRPEFDPDFFNLTVNRVVDRKQIGTTKNSRYQRLEGLPPTDWVFLEDSFSGNQLAILIALLAAAWNK